MGMEAKTLMDSRPRPLVGRLEGLSHDGGHRHGQDAAETRLAQMLGDFFRGGKEKRRRLLASTQGTVQNPESDDEADKYEPQRLTRKIHWQYDRSMKKVPMLRRDYIG